MKKSDLKVGDKLIQSLNGAGCRKALKITDIDTEYRIVGMGCFATSLDKVHINHKLVKEDGTIEEITED